MTQSNALETNQLITFRNRGVDSGNLMTIEVRSLGVTFENSKGETLVVVTGHRYSLAKRHFFGSVKAYTVNLSHFEITQAVAR